MRVDERVHNAYMFVYLHARARLHRYMLQEEPNKAIHGMALIVSAEQYNEYLSNNLKKYLDKVPLSHRALGPVEKYFHEEEYHSNQTGWGTKKVT